MHHSASNLAIKKKINKQLIQNHQELINSISEEADPYVFETLIQSLINKAAHYIGR
jgi:hypothetical protein